MHQPQAYVRASRAAVDISHLGARVEDEGILLEAVADLLHGAFELLAAQVFLLDPSGRFGELRYHVGVGDRKVLFKAPGVPVGSGSDLGAVLAGGEARVVGDVRGLPRGVVPPGADKGMALPLIVEGEVLGALVLYAAEAGIFSAAPPDVTPFAMLADILALALEAVRARGKVRLEKSRSQSPARPHLDKSATVALPGDGESPAGDSHTVPIKLDGSVVGTLSFREGQDRSLEPDEVELIENVADQVGQAIEHLHLLEEAQRAALREQLINDITAQLQRATSVDAVLRTAAQAVQSALGDVQVTARLVPDVVVSPPPAEEDEAK
jgi:GAF domain-containing protein